MFTEDTRTENLLKRDGVKFNYTNKVRFKDLRPGWDVRNLGRPQAKIEEAIFEYSTLMEQGSAAPAVILQKTDSGLDVLDGVQRLSAFHLLGGTEFSAYVIETDSERIPIQIRVLSNLRLQGHPEPVEWTKKHAVNLLVIERGMSCEEVAALTGWRLSDLVKLQKRLVCGFAVRCIGGPTGLSDGKLDAIANIVHLSDLEAAPKPIAEFLKVVDKSFTNGDSLQYISKFFAPCGKPKHLHTVYENRLNDFLSDPEVSIRIKGRPGGEMPLDINLRRQMRGCLSTINNMKETRQSPHYLDEFFHLWNKIYAELKSFQKTAVASENEK